jgi:hypothetical protein
MHDITPAEVQHFLRAWFTGSARPLHRQRHTVTTPEGVLSYVTVMRVVTSTMDRDGVHDEHTPSLTGVGGTAGTKGWAPSMTRMRYMLDVARK